MNYTMTKSWLFKSFTIPQQPPNQTCNARLWLNGQETYCQQATNGDRCEAHDVNKKRKKAAQLTFIEAHLLHQKAVELFERLLTERGLCHTVIVGFGELLDELSIPATSAMSSRLRTARDSEGQRRHSDALSTEAGEDSDG